MKEKEGPMKFIHIADIHLGAIPDAGMPWGKDRQKEIWDSFHHIIEVCNEEKADLLLIAGDLFHRQPLIRELKEVNYYFSKLTTAQVVLMAGNHDYISARSAYIDYPWDKRVHMFYQDSLETLIFPEINTHVYGFSYHQRDIMEPCYDSMKPLTDSLEPINTLVRPISNNKIHILLAHGGDDRDIPINKKKLMDSGFDYIALGHIHKPEIINDKIAYSGSLEPLDKNEIGERGFILGEINPSEEGLMSTTIRFVNSAKRQYIRLNLNVTQETTNGSLIDQAKEAINSIGVQHIYDIILTGLRDERIHFDKEAFKGLGNILDIIDQTVPDYDFDTLYRENADNLIGMFIKRIRENENQDEVVSKALYYGIEALIGASTSTRF